MVLSTKRCPYCGAVIPFLRPKKRPLYGSALRKCPQCDKAYIDTVYTEMALSGTTKADNRWFTPIWPITAALGAVVVVLALTDVVSAAARNIMLVFGLILTVAPLLVFGYEIATYGKRKQALEHELKESERRLQNPRYAKMLKDAGYRIPAKYLQYEKLPTPEKASKKQNMQVRLPAEPRPYVEPRPSVGKH